MNIKSKKDLEQILLKFPLPSEIERPCLINNYSELINLLNYIPKESHLKFLYYNGNNIGQILYAEDNLLKIDKEAINYNYIYDYFYLYKIIIDSKDIINYKYDFDLVNELIERMRAENKNLKKFILYIFAYSILYNYEESNDDSSSDDDKDKFNKIHNEIDEFMRNQQQIIKEFNLSLDLLNYNIYKIDDIYAEIIISLIKNRKLEDYNYSKNIMEQLDIENIELTNEMFFALKTLFDINSNEEYIKRYKITNDFNEKHINFYYILFKYVFKISYYIYQIAFFLDAQKSLKATIKNNDKILSKISDIELDEPKRLVLKLFLDLDFDFIINKYKKKYETNFSNSITDISKSTLTTLSNSTSSIKNNTVTNNSESLTNESSRKKEFNSKRKKEKKKKKKITTENTEKTEEEREKLNLINNTIKINYKSNNEEQREIIEVFKNGKYYYSFNYFKEHKKDFSNDKSSDEYKIFEYLSEFLTRLKNEYKKNSELIIEMKINKIDNDLEYNYNFNSHFFKDINKISKETFNYFINEINREKYSIKKEIKGKKTKIEKSKKKEATNKNLDETKKNQKTKNKIKYHKYKILYFKKVIGNHNENGGHNSAKFIKELSHENLRYISCGTDKVLRIYNSNFYEQNVNIILSKDISDCLSQKINEKNKKESSGDLCFFVFTKKDLILYYLDYGIFKSKCILSTIDEITCNSFLLIKNRDDESLIIAGKGGALCINNINKLLNNSEKVDKYRILKDIEYMGLIQINNNLIALTSNANLPRGKDKLVIYNFENSNKKEIQNFSFTISSNGLAVLIPETINNSNEFDERYLICACKKYSNDQKNGILFINASNNEFNYKFEETGDFEVYCFCQILERKSSNSNTTINNIDEETTPTNFFLVGGFDQTRGEGLIKLYKLIDNENTKQKKIKFLQDIEFKKYAEPEKEVEEIEEKQEKTDNTDTTDMDDTLLSNTPNQCQKSILLENESFEGFNGAISSIIQSTSTLNILVSCYDGKISLLSKVNLELYGKELKY